MPLLAEGSTNRDLFLSYHSTVISSLAEMHPHLMVLKQNPILEVDTISLHLLQSLTNSSGDLGLWIRYSRSPAPECASSPYLSHRLIKGFTRISLSTYKRWTDNGELNSFSNALSGWILDCISGEGPRQPGWLRKGLSHRFKYIFLAKTLSQEPHSAGQW